MQAQRSRVWDMRVFNKRTGVMMVTKIVRVVGKGKRMGMQRELGPQWRC